MKKKCPKCGEIKEENEFGKDATRADGRKVYCRLCRKSESDPNLEKDRKKKWYLANKELTIARQASRYTKKKDEVKAYRQEHYRQNAKQYKDKAIRWYEANKDDLEFKNRRRQRNWAWSQRNRHVIAWRSLLRAALKRLGRNKDDSTCVLLGYSALELKSHLEKLWTPEMTWNNYGDWHIDHIKPLHTFDKSADMAVVNALTNLRPLWSTDRVVNGVFYEGNLNRGKSCKTIMPLPPRSG